MSRPGAVRLNVAELFGPTFQGEGPSAGQRAAFVRLSGCNLACSWCDTPYTWDRSRFDLHAESYQAPVGDLVAWALGIQVGLVVVTGGEPMLQEGPLTALVAALADAGRRVEVETNGTVVPLPALAVAVSRFNVSPKLANSRLPVRRRIRPGALAALVATGKAVFKFVVCDAADLAEIAELVAAYRLSPVWVMPEGTTEARVLTGMRELADLVLARGWHLTGRQHVLLWGDTRGR